MIEPYNTIDIQYTHTNLYNYRWIGTNHDFNKTRRLTTNSFLCHRYPCLVYCFCGNVCNSYSMKFLNMLVNIIYYIYYMILLVNT